MDLWVIDGQDREVVREATSTGKYQKNCSLEGVDVGGFWVRCEVER